jgi:hypothetical protein
MNGGIRHRVGNDQLRSRVDLDVVLVAEVPPLSFHRRACFAVNLAFPVRVRFFGGFVCLSVAGFLSGLTGRFHDAGIDDFTSTGLYAQPL